ncbi:hypothetical protein RhiirA4_546706 [Rhizophagus irregularis]|uniref:Uncharacterized protein n=1 Tax=Rhizophagus irregularis TaxID=588596 RepID=A0A2I1GYK2_9GLOM|nr:hypothetical protein RhiirA4_546706 [Rhizophagus irregularis]
MFGEKPKQCINLIDGYHINIERYKLGRMNQTCIYYDEKFWIDERDNNSSKFSSSFATCCAGG